MKPSFRNFIRTSCGGKAYLAPIVFVRSRMHPLPVGQGAYSQLYFFYYFATAATSFTAAYLNERGVSGTQVGVIMAVVNMFGILSAPIAGGVSDALGSTRKVLVACLSVASVFYFLTPFFFKTAILTIPVSVLLLPLWSLFKTPVPSLVDSMTAEYVGQKRTFTYGSVRCLGSIGYAAMCLVFGIIATRTGTQAYAFYLYPLLNIPVLIVLLRMRAYEPEPCGHARAKAHGGGPGLALKSYYFKVFLLTHAALSLPVYCLSTFLPYKLVEVTGSASAMGAVIAVRSLMEVPALIFGARLAARFGARKTILFCGAAFALEQALSIVATGLFPMMLALLIQGVTYGTYLSCAIDYIFRITPHEAGASAQTVAGALTSLSAIVGNLAGGVLVDAFGTVGYYLFTLTLIIAGLALFQLSFPLGRKLGHALPEGVSR